MSIESASFVAIGDLLHVHQIPSSCSCSYLSSCLLGIKTQVHELILERYCFVLGWITLSDIDVKEAGALPWSPELGRDKLLEIEYFISFIRILRHNVHFGHTGELSQLATLVQKRGFFHGGFPRFLLFGVKSEATGTRRHCIHA